MFLDLNGFTELYKSIKNEKRILSESKSGLQKAENT